MPTSSFYEPKTNWSLRDIHLVEVIAERHSCSPEEASRMVAEAKEQGGILPTYAGPHAFYDEGMQEMLEDEMGPSRNNIDPLKATQLMVSFVEKAWYGSGNPQYLVHPEMAEALVRSSMDIESSKLKLPFPSLCIRLPIGWHKTQSIIAGIMASKTKDSGALPGVAIRSFAELPFSPTPLWLPIEIRNAGEQVPAILFAVAQCSEQVRVAQIGLRDGETLEKSFRRIDRQAYDDDIRAIMALVVGVSLFATGEVKANGTPLVSPGGATRSEKRRFKRKHGTEIPSFEVGRSLVVPRTETNKSSSSQPAVRELTCAHYRTGHVRYQWVGSTKDRSNPSPRRQEIRFIMPTVIRPDLPMKKMVTPNRVVMPKGEASQSRNADMSARKRQP